MQRCYRAIDYENGLSAMLSPDYAKFAKRKSNFGLMKSLVAATNNKGKLKEIRQLLPWNMSLQSLQDIGFSEDIPEPYDTFEENAATKARTVHEFCGQNTIADDSGICVEALQGAPGVYSARYAGEGATDAQNLQRLIEDMKGQPDRRAYYKAVICLIWEGEIQYFEGTCHGTLAEAPTGKKGFGYDPIFIPDGYTQTFGELSAEVKNKLSHRGEAIRKMMVFIESKKS